MGMEMGKIRAVVAESAEAEILDCRNIHGYSSSRPSSVVPMRYYDAPRAPTGIAYRGVRAWLLSWAAPKCYMLTASPPQ